jgi:hypothetical protein
MRGEESYYSCLAMRSSDPETETDREGERESQVIFVLDLAQSPFAWSADWRQVTTEEL